jgi:DNA-binding GntR family transcriptional regulator
MPEREGRIFKRAGDSMRTDIRSGVLVGRLPSMDILARTYGVSRVTMRKAMLYLQDEGLLNIKQGRGTSVTSFVTSLKEPQEGEARNFTNEFPDTFKEAVGHYIGFLVNPRIPRELKIRMIGIIDTQIGLVEQSQQPTINPK